MKFLLKLVLKYYLKYITKLVLFIHKPIIIAVAGSANKTFVKNKIVETLKEKGISVRANPKSFNTEIGLPLGALYLKSGYNSYKKWLPVIGDSLKAIWRKNFPKYLVLELGISDPKDMKYLLSIIKPKIAIITDINQRYLESFGDIDKLAGEYEYLAKKLPKQGLLIINEDNSMASSLKNITKAEINTYSLEKKSDWQALKIEKKSTGQNITVASGRQEKEYFLKRFGAHHIYALLIALIIENYVNLQKRP